jgi:tRNA-splicing ligase RtcB
MDPSPLQKITDYIWEIPPDFKAGMNVPARIYASDKLLTNLDDGVVEQITNVATLPGLVGYALAMPDAHWGYGAPIGAVFATDPDQDGIISPGAVGFDINCGMRLLRTNLTLKDVQPRIKDLVDLLFTQIPTGVGCSGSIRPSISDFQSMLVKGAAWAVDQGFGWPQDLDHIEEQGSLPGANPDKVSLHAIKRGLKQLGTLGSGNHYLEIQVVKKANIIDPKLAQAFNITPDQIMIMFHCGSRGFGHQVATDYLKLFNQVMPDYHLTVPDRELACALFNSPHGQDYYAAMACAVNAAFANRQVITHRIREVFQKIFNQPAEQLGFQVIYDVAHNIAKVEKHQVPNVHPSGSKSSLNRSGLASTQRDKVSVGRHSEATSKSSPSTVTEESPSKSVRHPELVSESSKVPDQVRNDKNDTKLLIVHRKGATRAFGPGHPDLPSDYRDIGQPVILGGSMETGSYLLTGTKTAELETFGSTAHGSGRTMSRTQAKKQVQGSQLQKDMERRGIYVRSASRSGLAEEAGLAYKNISDVVQAISGADISHPVVSLVPIGNIKG